MTYSDDDLDRLFRAANPSGTFDSSTLTAAEISVREAIIRGTYRRPRRHARRIPWAATVAVVSAATVAVLVMVNVLAPAQQAIALTPPPLTYTAAGVLPDVIDDAVRRLAEPPDVVQRSSVHSVVWGWNADLAEDRVEIVPQKITFDWAPGEPAVSTIVAGDSYWSENDRPEGVDPSPYRPGEVIDIVRTPPEEFTLPAEVQTLSGSTEPEMMAALASFGATSTSTSGELFAAVTGLLQYWTLTDEQQAALLRLLVRAGGMTVRGETTDRVGRDVVGLQVSSVIPERVETIFISISTGRIVGMESELVKPLNGLPAGVITYKMWDADRHDR